MQFALVFFLALGLYAATYSWIEKRRVAQGPWEVTFRAGPGSDPRVTVDQPRLGITNISFVFAGARVGSNVEQRVVFDGPKTNVPFGRVVFFDTTFLPGTVTFELFGHEIELLRRVLVVDQKEIEWRPGVEFVMTNRISTDTLKR